MNGKKFENIHAHVLSDPTRRIRRNSLIVSSVCLFLAMSNTLPSEIGMLGMKLAATEHKILVVSLTILSFYYVLYFLVSAVGEAASWYREAFLPFQIRKEVEDEEVDDLIYDDPGPPPPKGQDLAEIFEYCRDGARSVLYSRTNWAMNKLWAYSILVFTILVPILLWLVSTIFFLLTFWRTLFA